MGRPITSAEGFWDRPLQDLFELLQATPAGLTTEEASRRLASLWPKQPGPGVSLRCTAQFFCVSSRILSSSFFSLPAAYLLHWESTSAG